MRKIYFFLLVFLLVVATKKTNGQAPTVTINQAAAQPDPTGISPINYTVIFSEPVTGFTNGDVTLSGTAGATVQNITGGPTTYNVAVSGMTGTGTVITNIAAGVATGTVNVFDNAASTSTDNTVTYNAPAGCTSVAAVPNQAVCSGSSTAPVIFTSPTPGTNFSWTNNSTSIGLAASGTGNIPAFTATNATTSPVVATITVTPVLNVVTPTTTTFNFTGGAQTFTVPAGVTSINLTTLGAEGGTGATGGNAASGGAGGKGSRATGTLAVTPGQVLTIFVGGAGGTPTAGFNGGGAGGNTNSGGGGGASDVRFPGASTADRILVAGGGGGGGRAGCEPNTVIGGAGGNGDGNGQNGAASPNGGGGFGAIGVVPGLQGIGCTTFLGSPGLAGTGAAGGNGGAGQTCCCFNATSVPGGGGGGGGYLGGAGGGGGSAGTVACTGQDKGGGGGGAGGTSYTGGVVAGAVTTNIQTGNGQVVLNYNVATSCTGTPRTFTITVNPTPTIVATPASSQAVCSGTAIATITTSSNLPTATLSWTRDNTTNVTGIANSGSGDINGTPINNTTTLQFVNFVITAAANGCSFSTSVFLTVRPLAAISAVPNQVVCNNTPTAPVNFTTTPAGGVVSWTNNTPSIGLAASGTGNIPAFTATNSGTAPLVATITATTTTPTSFVTPTTTTFNFIGGAQTFTVPAGVTSINLTTLGAEGGSGATGGNAASGGAGGKGSRATGTLAVTPGQVLTIFVGGAGGTPTAGFNGGGAGGNTNSGGGGGASDVRFPGASTADRILVAGGGGGGGRAGCEPNTVIGGAGGNGDGNGQNGAASPNGGGGFGAIGVVPGLQGIGCTTFLGSPGLAGTGAAGGNGGAGQTCCCFNATSVPGGGGGGGGYLGGAGGGGGSAGTVACTGQDKGGGGGGAGGTSYTGGVVAGAVTTNIQTGNGQVVLNYNVTTTTNCISTRTFTITVNPTSTAVATPSSQTICSNTAMTTIALTGNVAGTTFNWTRDNTTNVTGIANSGSGASISGTPVNNTTTQQTVLYTITPTANGCTGTPITATLIVNKTPTITCPSNITAPSVLGTCSAVVNYTTTVTGGPVPTLTYTLSGATTGSGSGNGTGSSFNLGVTTVTVTATNVCGTATCSFTVTITDSQLPVISSQPQSIARCTGLTATFSVTSTNALSYQWQLYNGTAWVDVSGATGATLSLAGVAVSQNTNTYRVLVIGLCTTVTSGTATLTVFPAAAVSVLVSPASILPTQTANLTAVVNNGLGSFVWSFNGSVLPGITGQFVTGLDATKAGVYRVVYTDPNGCVATSADATLTAIVTDLVLVYPNPNQGSFHVRFYNQANEKATINIYNSQGQRVYSKAFTTGTPYTQLDITLGAENSNGIYTVEVIDGSGNIKGTKRLLINTH